MENRRTLCSLLCKTPKIRRFLLQIRVITDCSQTLYEFRASNPRALNVLESSGIFTTYQLEVNYRSRQEILDFANVLLDTIEANQYAQLQLKANSLTPVTAQSFQDHVKFAYVQVAKLKDINDMMGTILANTLRTYIDSKLVSGEKVAFLAYTRQHIQILEELLKKMYPNQTIASLVPEKIYNTTIFSDFIRKYWDGMSFVPTSNLINIISAEVIKMLPFMSNRAQKALPAVQHMLGKWEQETRPVVNGWLKSYNAGRMTKQELLEMIKKQMLEYEIANNAVKQSLLSERNKEKKNSDEVKNANILLSTIHSAKGLEFDNVVVIYHNNTRMSEADKRMYYVAFTRAMHSEYILAYDTVAKPGIEADYQTILDQLNAKNPASGVPGNRTSQNITVQIS